MTIYSVLAGEHNEIILLFQALEMAPEGLESGRKSVFSKLRKELLSHTEAEKRTVYDRVRKITKNEALVNAALEAHAAIEQHVEEIDKLDLNSNEWIHKIHELKSQVEHHIDTEENAFFAEMERLFTNDEAESIARAFHEEKNELLKALDRN